MKLYFRKIIAKTILKGNILLRVLQICATYIQRCFFHKITAAVIFTLTGGNGNELHI